MVTRARSPRRPAQRPDQILDAAERLLLNGATDLTMDALAEAAGLGKGTLYHYYASKTDVLDALRRRYLERSSLRALTAAPDEPSKSALSRMETFIRALLDDATANAALVWTLFHDHGIAGKGDLEIVSATLGGLIQDGVARGDFSIDNPEAVASFFAHGFFGRIQDAFHGTGVQPAELATELTGLLERLVTPVRER